MNRPVQILELAAIDAWARHFARAPGQLNRTHESDAELVEIPGDSTHLLAVTVDTVAEEITEGLYRHPFTMGWVTVMASLSDLAAVGAEPLGLVASVSVEPDRSRAFTEGIAEGMAAACAEAGVFCLGGDTNTTRSISLTACAFGLVPKTRTITRVGCRHGDTLFISGTAGSGSALGLSRYQNSSVLLECSYRPTARLTEGCVVRQYATCCMDTSDGVLPALDQLVRLNGMGFRLDVAAEEFLHPAALQLARGARVAPWLMLSGPHGEFELLFTIPEVSATEFVAAARTCGWSPIRIGAVVASPEVQLIRNGSSVAIDTGYVRNAFSEAHGDVGEYIKRLVALDESMGREVRNNGRN